MKAYIVSLQFSTDDADGVDIEVFSTYEKAVKICTTITGILSAISSVIVTATNDINNIISYVRKKAIEIVNNIN